MNKFHIALAAAATLSVAACGKKDETPAVENNMDAATDNYTAVSDNAANTAEADALKNQAEQLNATAANATAKTDSSADAEQAKKEVNAM